MSLYNLPEKGSLLTRAAVLLTAACAAACTPSVATELIVVVNSSGALAFDSVDVTVAGHGRESSVSHEVPGDRLPFSIGIAPPSGDAENGVRVEVRGYAEIVLDRVIAAASADADFEADQRLAFSMCLSEACERHHGNPRFPDTPNDGARDDCITTVVEPVLFDEGMEFEDPRLTMPDERCDGYDNDCDGRVDEGTVQFYVDGDGDGVGTNVADGMFAACGESLMGLSDRSGDCDDANANVHSGAPEVCDGLDNDCDGQVDETGPSSCRDLHLRQGAQCSDGGPDPQVALARVHGDIALAAGVLRTPVSTVDGSLSFSTEVTVVTEARYADGFAIVLAESEPGAERVGSGGGQLGVPVYRDGLAFEFRYNSGADRPRSKIRIARLTGDGLRGPDNTVGEEPEWTTFSVGEQHHRIDVTYSPTNISVTVTTTTAASGEEQTQTLSHDWPASGPDVGWTDATALELGLTAATGGSTSQVTWHFARTQVRSCL